ncbi:O-acetyltransferase OatA [Microbacterium lemovicicum]|uniref:O-acetyltransferase OatA n=2 Tax=Microbacterium lemovicicum TaxID=1072463 RepID=A0A3Q9IZQ9_9MICO|nr:O-acetyltransferase OatA [Microbacterium lemovicicum]
MLDPASPPVRRPRADGPMTAPVTAAPPAAARPRAPFRTDIQALRAVAIGAVVLNHLWPTVFTGGYVGVDVFFVISGFLITGHLWGELERTGRVRLGAFYSRRIRRLLPAALLVLTVAAALVALFLPYTRWARNAGEIAASAGYVENWFLSAMSVNYSALNDSASVAQHYWSLSVEEQFYLIWPLLLAGAVLWGGRRLSGASPRRRRAFTALAVVGVLSFAASVVFTAVTPAQAYFITFTRAWEFAVGGLIALGATLVRVSKPWAQTLSLAGAVAVVASVFLYDHETAFPGVAAALPALGTAAIIIAGTVTRPLWHTRLSAAAPVQWLGGVSYSLYLWHWPLIVVAPFALSMELRTPVKIGILAVALLLAWATKNLVEDPGQRWRWWSGSVRRAVGGMVAGILVVLLCAGALLVGSQLRGADDVPTAALPTGSCVGPDALAPGADCPDAFAAPASVEMTAKNEYFYTPPECGGFLDILSYGDKQTTTRCDFGAGQPTADVWLVGDSHAQQWQGAVFDLARERGWRVTTSYYGGCPAADVAFRGFREPWGQPDIDQCVRWSREVAGEIATERPQIVFTSMAAREQIVDDGSGSPEIDQFAAGLERDWTRWADAGSQVVALADPPLNGVVRSPDCLLLAGDDPVSCARPRAEAQPADPLVVAAQAIDRPDVRLIDLTDRFCDASLCYAAVGGLPVYYDADHLNLQFVRLLAPVIASTLDAGPAQAAG